MQDAGLIDYAELATLVPYSRRHLLRLEARGAFPGRVHLSAKKVVWVRSEILSWIKENMRARGEEG